MAIDKLLTIIVPSYNMEAYLPKCLGSLVVSDNSMLRRLEVLVVNDGSTDRTSEIAHDFERRYPGVFRVIDKANGNYGSCINAALPATLGDYVKIVDADDSVASDGFVSLLRQLQKELEKPDKRADLVVTDYDWVAPDDSVLSHVAHPFPPGEDRCFSDLAPMATSFKMHALVYKRSVFDNLDYHQTEGISYTDVEWAIEPCVSVRRITYLPVTVTRYLVGRVGQTVGNLPMSRNYWHMVEIAKGLARRFPQRLRTCVPEARTYYKTQTLSFIAETYRDCIYGFHGHRVNADIRELDRCIRGVPEVYRESEAFRMRSSHFPLRLMHAWRRHPGTGTPALAVYWLFLNVKDFKRWIRRRFQRD